MLAGTCDLPAKSLILNTIQYNGKHGCSKCLDPGFTFHTSARGHTHVYPYQASNASGHGSKRSSSTHEDDVKKAEQNNSIVNGVKGRSWLMKLSHYDIIKGTGIAFVDKRLLAIKPPSTITRRPRKLSEHMKYYKASEYRSFLLYYSLPVLRDVLPEDYWNHYALLVVSIYYLLQQSISEEQLANSEKMLKKFCRQFEILYGRRYMTANVHNLLHLTDCIRELGPLWAYSCFHFESQNGALKSLVHGTQQVEKQIMASFVYRKNLPAAAVEIIPETSMHFTAFEHLFLDYQHHINKKNCLKVDENIFVMGKSIKDRLDEN